MAWIESGEAAEGRDQRRGKHNKNRDDPHLTPPKAATERATGFTKNGDRGGKYGFLTHQVFTFLEAVYMLQRTSKRQPQCSAPQSVAVNLPFEHHEPVDVVEGLGSFQYLASSRATRLGGVLVPTRKYLAMMGGVWEMWVGCTTITPHSARFVFSKSK